MPGKVNPTQCEVLTMIAAHVQGAHAAVAFAGSQGQLQLNVYRPVMIWNFLHSVDLLEAGCRSFTDHLVAGMGIHRGKLEDYVRNSLMIATALNPVIGYDRAARVAKKAHDEGTSVRDACLALGYLGAEEFDRIVSKVLKETATPPSPPW
jgi:fumarate hydratase class II